MIWIILGAGILVGIFSLSAYFYGTALFEAWFEVKNKPREKMMWCHKHGMVRMRHAIDLGYTQVCPLCYREALEQAEQS